MRKSNYLTKVFAACMSLAVAVSTITVANIKSEDVQAAETGSRYQLVWSDEFNGTSLNTNNWTALEGNGGHNPGWGNNELEYYTDNEENLKVADGTLQITARKSETPLVDEINGAECYYTSARITSTQKQNFKYGKIEARIKVPAVDGLWPAFWTMGDDEPKGWPLCGEIDILETWNTDQIAQGAFHWNVGEEYNWDLGTNRFQAFSRRRGSYGFKDFDKTEYHVYGMEWDEDYIKWSVDDFVYMNWKVSLDPEKADELKHHYYILFNMAVGGNLTHGATIDEANLPATMYVDYVRVYQLTNSNAQYTKKWTEQSAVPKHTVRVLDGSKVISSATVYDGETIILGNTIALPNLTKKGYVFNGYATKTGVEITNDTRITGNVDFIAQWTKVSVKKAKISKLTAKKKKMKVKVKAIEGAVGYQIKYGRKKSFKGAKKKTITKTSTTIKKLKSKKKYYFKVRAYKLDSQNKKVYGKWSTVKSKKVK